MDNESIDYLAAKHLGSKQGDYSKYAGLTEVTPSLLVPIPRNLNRQEIAGFEPMCGCTDVWHGYEISTLLDNGYTVNACAQIFFYDTPNIIESKSMKLYWNSYNLAKVCGKATTLASAYTKIENLAQEHLREVAQGKVSVRIISSSHVGETTLRLSQVFTNIDTEVLAYKPRTEKYQRDASLLKVNTLTTSKVTTNVTSSCLRSNCRITKQPDFADIAISYTSHKIIEAESLLSYLVSYRNENHFHEECADQIYTDIKSVLNPGDDLSIACYYTRRGGWDITPIRTSRYLVFDEEGFGPLYRRNRQ